MRHGAFTGLVSSSLVCWRSQGRRCLPADDSMPMMPQPAFIEHDTDTIPFPPVWHAAGPDWLSGSPCRHNDGQTGGGATFGAGAPFRAGPRWPHGWDTAITRQHLTPRRWRPGRAGGPAARSVAWDLPPRVGTGAHRVPPEHSDPCRSERSLPCGHSLTCRRGAMRC
jgi:hypothetical protein